MPSLEAANYTVDSPAIGKRPLDSWFQESCKYWFVHDQVEHDEEIGLHKEVVVGLLVASVQEEKLKELLDSLVNIEAECRTHNWDGYGAKPVSSGAIREIKLLSTLLPPYLSVPDVVPEPTGGIGLEWRKGDAMLILSVQGEGVVSFAAILDAETKRYGRDKFATTIPQLIQKEFFPFFKETF